MSAFFFYLFATVLILASLTVVLARNPLYNVLSLVVVIFCLASLFMLMEAFFVGIILLLVYAGAVLVFFLFVIMCLNLTAPTFTSAEQNRIRLLGSFIAFLFLAEFSLVIKSFLAAEAMAPSTMQGTIEEIGRALFRHHLLAFELISFILLVAVIGVTVISRKEKIKAL